MATPKDTNIRTSVVRPRVVTIDQVGAVAILVVVFCALCLGCGETKEARLDRYKALAKTKQYAWAGDAAVGLAAYEAHRPGPHPRGDYEIAVEQWRPLAEAGNVIAQNFMGNAYFAGHGVKKDRREAVRWYRLAVAKGYVGAMTNLAHLFANDTTLGDIKEAVKLYEVAAEHGDTLAPYSLGQIYEKSDEHWAETAAYFWYRISVERGDRFLSTSTVERVQRRMTPSQLREAEASVARWLTEHPPPITKEMVPDVLQDLARDEDRR